MTLSVLTDTQIQSLLENLTGEELVAFQKGLKDALFAYSNSTPGGPETGSGTESREGPTGGSDTSSTPARTTVKNAKTGTSTLFMPSCSEIGTGVKGEFCRSRASRWSGERR